MISKQNCRMLIPVINRNRRKLYKYHQNYQQLHQINNKYKNIKCNYNNI